MPLVRLTGLMLFVTSIFLALAAAATKTTSLKFKIRDSAGSQLPPDDALSSGTNVATGTVTSSGPRFRRVPIVWPLTIAGLAGLLMWFVPAPIAHGPPPKRRRRKRRTRR